VGEGWPKSSSIFTGGGEKNERGRLFITYPRGKLRITGGKRGGGGEKEEGGVTFFLNPTPFSFSLKTKGGGGGGESRGSGEGYSLSSFEEGKRGKEARDRTFERKKKKNSQFEAQVCSFSSSLLPETPFYGGGKRGTRKK